MSSNILLLLLILLLIYLIHKKKEREKERTFVSMTSDDAHLPFIHKTLDSLLNGQLSPDKIILNLPNHKHNIPISLTNPKYKDKLVIQKCNNYGAGNNFLPTLLNRKKLGILKNDNILVTSDKIDYPHNFLKGMVSKCRRHRNRAIINKTICKDCPSVIVKSMGIHNIDTSVDSEEVQKKEEIPIPSEESINVTAEQDYNINIPREKLEVNEDEDFNNISGNEMPYDNMEQKDLYSKHLYSPKYEINTEVPEDIPQFSDNSVLPPIPKITIDRNKKLIQPDRMYVREKCNPQNETCSYTKNQFHNKFTRIDFIPDAKKYTIVKKHLDMNNIESFTI